MNDLARRKEQLRMLRDDLELAARKLLKIRDKAGNMVPFVFNTAQKYAHEQIEKQRAQTGKVRVIFLKGRQQGISTYTAARFYHRSTMWRGVNVYILAHEQSASDNLFAIVERYHENNPLAPHTGISNAKELRFDRLDSGYVVATAGQKAGGRSRTSTLMHGSEAAFWTNASEHFSSSVQTVPDMDGTEIILESTANGPDGEFYERWYDAIAGRSDYMAVFIPWFWQSEYRRPVPPDFQLDETAEEGELSEAEYAEMFGLDAAQMVWRRMKISELRSVKRFDREYPATPEMAFVTADSDPFISAVSVLRARKRKGVEGYGPKIMGVDPAGPGGDRFAIAMRQGYKIPWIKWRDKLGTAEALAWLRDMIEEHQPDIVFIDAGGIGHGVLSGLRSESDYYRKLVKGVNFGGTSEHKLAKPKIPGPKNRRAEMWVRMKEWLDLEEGVSLPDMDVLQADMTAPQTKPTVSNDILLESKDQMRARGIRSPDLADSVALTFASLRAIKPPKGAPAHKTAQQQDREAVAPKSKYRPVNNSTSWMA